MGEFGFGKVIGVGEYFLIPQKNIAEIAFTVSKAYQGKGIGKILLRKLLKAARENGIAGLDSAYLSAKQKNDSAV